MKKKCKRWSKWWLLNDVVLVTGFVLLAFMKWHGAERETPHPLVARVKGVKIVAVNWFVFSPQSFNYAWKKIVLFRYAKVMSDGLEFLLTDAYRIFYDVSWFLRNMRDVVRRNCFSKLWPPYITKCDVFPIFKGEFSAQSNQWCF